MLFVAKTTSLNLRISPELRGQIEVLAEFHGLSMSSYAHSLLVKSIRQEAAKDDFLATVTSKREHNVNGIKATSIRVGKPEQKRKTG